MDEPMFVIERGRARYRLTPRTATGLLACMVYMALLLGPMIPVMLLRLNPALLFLLLPWAALLTWLFFRWARPRAKVIDLLAVERDYEAFQEWRKQQGKRR